VVGASPAFLVRAGIVIGKATAHDYAHAVARLERTLRQMRSIANAAVAGMLVLFTWCFTVSGCGQDKSEGSTQAIDLAAVVPMDTRQQVLAGTLVETNGLAEVLGKYRLLDQDGLRTLCLLGMDAAGLSRRQLLSVSPDGQIVCATFSGSRTFTVEEDHHGENVKVRTAIGEPEVVFRTPRGIDNSDPPHVHSLSVSPAGDRLAFMVSDRVDWASWDAQRLKIYDIAGRGLREIWHGDICGPTGILSPYAWVQPLPWSPDGKEVLLSVPPGDIVAVDVTSGSQRALCRGYLPIGFAAAQELLILERSGGRRAPRWCVAVYDQGTKRRRSVLDIAGPTEMRAPLLSPGGEYISFVARIFPGGTPRKGIYLYTLIIRRKDLAWGLISATVTGWSE